MKIVIASVLKPLDDTRHYHKLAKTLAEEPDNEVHVLARQSKEEQSPEHPTIHFHPLLPGSYTFFQRSTASFRFLRLILQLEPELLIVCTHELLLMAVFAKYITGCRLVYDVQENYVLNIQSNETYRGFRQKVAAVLVKTEETWTRHFVDQFWLAETCYLSELSIPKDKAVVLQNKAISYRRVQPFSLKEKSTITLLFTGTVAEETGIWEAFALSEQLHQADPRFELHVKGCCHNQDLLRQLENTAASKSFISFHVSAEPLPYSSVLQSIEQADIGLVLYRPLHNFQDKMPTKVFEYSAMGLGIVSTVTLLLTNFYRMYQNAALFHNEKSHLDILILELNEKVFYPNGNEPLEPLLWEAEKGKMQEAVKRLFSSPF